MTRSLYVAVLFASIAGAFLVGTRYRQPAPGEKGSAGVRRILYYTDPMHPAYKSDKPGTAPDCGMQLKPVYAGGGPSGVSEDQGMPTPRSGAVMIGAGMQFSGVRTSPVEKASGQYTLRLFGRVAPDEGRIYRLNAGIEGYIQEVSAVTTGSQVQKDQLLATFSAPSAVMTFQTYILNLGAEDRFQKAAAADSPEAQNMPSVNANLQQRIQQMQNLGVSLTQMEEIKRTRVIPDRIKILAPADGFVLARNVSPGLKFDRGAEWYRIANLSKVWVLADVFEQDARYLHSGARARVAVPGQAMTLAARVSEVLPQFDATSRTLKVRLEVDNPGFHLRPDMFVDVELPVNLPAAIAVPADAVLDSGLKRTVFVDRGEGIFEPREVETGWRFDGQVQIVKGLEPGDRIVTAGNFLLDSESRMKTAPPATSAKLVTDPVCGMELDAGQAGHHSDHRGQRYYFCSSKCERDFTRRQGMTAAGAD